MKTIECTSDSWCETILFWESWPCRKLTGHPESFVVFLEKGRGQTKSGRGRWKLFARFMCTITRTPLHNILDPPLVLSQCHDIWISPCTPWRLTLLTKTRPLTGRPFWISAIVDNMHRGPYILFWKIMARGPNISNGGNKHEGVQICHDSTDKLCSWSSLLWKTKTKDVCCTLL